MKSTKADILNTLPPVDEIRERLSQNIEERRCCDKCFALHLLRTRLNERDALRRRLLQREIRPHHRRIDVRDRWHG